MSSLLGQPAPSKWVRLNSSIVVSRLRYPEGEAVGVSGPSWTMPNGRTAPGYVLPPAPPGTGLGELLSSVPISGLTNWVRLSAAAGSAVSSAAPAPAAGPTRSSPVTAPPPSGGIMQALEPRTNAITALPRSTRTGHLLMRGWTSRTQFRAPGVCESLMHLES